MESFIKILPFIIVVVLIFLIKEGLSLYGYLKYCKLHEAAKRGDAGKIGELLEAGYPVNVLDTRFGLTPLHYAVRNGHLEIAKLLIRQGASLSDMSSQGVTPLQWSSEYLSPDQQNELARVDSEEEEKRNARVSES